MGCGCSKRAAARSAAQSRAAAPSRDSDASGAVIAAARAGGAWRLTTAGGTIYDFPTLAEARAGQRSYGGSVSKSR